MTKLCKLLSPIIGICAFLLVGTVHAVPITVDNFSFEGPGCPTAGVGDCIGESTLGPFTIGSIDGWDVIGTGEAGVYRPTDVVFNAGFPTDGLQSGYANSTGIIEQDGLATIAAGLMYTLTIDVGRRKDPCCTTLDFEISLTANGVDIGMVDETGFLLPAEGDWGTIVLTLVADASVDGQSLGIRLMSFASQTNWDNVRLADSSTTTSVPEPGTLALLGLGLFGMGLARRRQKV